MKRTPFKPKGYAPRLATQSTYSPRPRAAAVAIHDGKARMVVPVPRFAYVRDERLRDMCRAMPCQHCFGAVCRNLGVTWAHSNQARHGKGKSIKASDVYVAAMGTVCHAEIDQGKTGTREQKAAIWQAAHERTVAMALQMGTWPKGIEPPC